MNEQLLKNMGQDPKMLDVNPKLLGFDPKMLAGLDPKLLYDPKLLAGMDPKMLLGGINPRLFGTDP